MLRPGHHPHFAGVLGWPLDHTLSPALHNAAFRHMGLAWTYLAFPVPPDALADAVAGLRALGAAGANVTMPHKEAVAELLDDLSGDARATGAVNTIHRVGDRLVGHNTDVDGFGRFVTEDAGLEPRGMSALVLGAGGAARAVAKALDDLGAGRVTIAARRRERGAAVAELLDSAGGEVVGWDERARVAPECDLVVNATPLDDDDLLPAASLAPGVAVIDLLYEPPITPLVERARAAGGRSWGGLGMLVQQAAASFRIWTGQDAPVDIMSATALRSVGPRGR